jgi:hypothetical protein
VRRLLVMANVVPSSPILVALMKEALSSSETRFLQEPHGVTSQKTTFFKVYPVGLYGDNTLHSYSEDAEFKSHMRHQLTRLRFLMVFLSPSRQMLG